MCDFLELYDIKVIGNKIELEALYVNDEGINNLKVFLQSINSEERIYFSLIDKYYGNNNNIRGYKCKVVLDINYIANYKIMIDNNNKVYESCWYNNQKKVLDFNKNKFYIFTNNFIIKFNNNGFITDKKYLFSKIKYNIEKTIYGIATYKKLFIFRFLKFKEKYYIINDRVTEGNDNGEALFKYIYKNDKKIARKTYYLIDKSNKNKYNELKKIGKVLKFKSFKHKLKFLNSKIIITSYIGNGANVYNPFSDSEMEIYRDLINKKTIFLQHGILMSDYHLMFNRARMVIDRFVISTKKEHDSILKYNYLYEDGQLIKTGLARHDLLKNNCQNKILIFFTWRKWLSNLNRKQFANSKYFLTIKSLLTNHDFINNFVKKNYQIELVLHAELTKFYDVFKSLNSNYIKVYKSRDIEYSDKFNKCNMLITDYSSIHFDIAYLKKPIIYYQFDSSEFFNNHTSNGFSEFDYSRDGFGDVTSSENEVIDLTNSYIKNDCKMKEKYIDKVNKTFYNLDGNNSKRISEIIKQLSSENSKNYRFNNVQ